MRSTGGGQFGQTGEKLHENDKISILWSKQWCDMERTSKAYFSTYLELKSAISVSTSQVEEGFILK